MQNSVAAGRRLAVRVVLVQLGFTLLVASGFLLQGWSAGLAALVGGTVVVAGTAVLALRLFAAGPASAGTVLIRLFVGTLLKWLVIVAGFYLAFAQAGLPPLPIVAGIIAALIPQLFGLHDGWMERT